MIGELLAAACSDPAILARIGGPLGVAARAAVQELAAQPDRKRRATRAAWAAVARMPVPAGIRGVHASWIEAGLAGLPFAARSALASVATDPASVWLARWACSELVPLPADDQPRPPRAASELARLASSDLAAWLADVGADQLAFALASAPEQALASTARIVGDVLIHAATRIRQPPRAGALGPARAAIARCRVSLVDHGLVTIGARAIAPHVDAMTARQLAVRLPRSLGLVVATALREHAATPLDQVPSWVALGAG